MGFSVGCQLAEVVDPSGGGGISLIVLYPSMNAEAPAKLGPYPVHLAMDGVWAEGTHPLLLISHGRGGTPLVYRDLACRLAREGYVVLMPTHPGDNREDLSRSETFEILSERPRHLSLVADWAFREAPFRDSLRETEGMAVIGHSMGGYTGLAAAGGVPSAVPPGAPPEDAVEAKVRPDSRVRALVLLSPATPWFQKEGALAKVSVPILLMTAEKDEHAPSFFGHLVLEGVPDPSRVKHREIANAGHFSFLSPFPEEMRVPCFPPAHDPKGFDREAFQKELSQEILQFLRATSGIHPSD